MISTGTQPRSVSLLRQLGLVSATALVVSNMIGTGIFTTTGFMIGDLGDGRLVLLIWMVGAVFALCGALSYSELGVNFPSSGGEYVYLTRAFGAAWGFMSGWISFFAGFSAPIAAAALAFADYAGYFHPALRQANGRVFGSGAFALKVGGAQVAACVLIATFTIVNFFGVKRVARLQNVLTGTKLLVIGGLILAGFTLGRGDWSHLWTPAARTSSNPVPVAFVISLLWVMVGYSGWNAATYVGEEVKQPDRTLPAALGIGTGIVTVAYLGLNLLFIYATPLEKMKNVVAVGSLAAANLFGPNVGGVFAALMAVSLMSTVNAMVTIGPRVYYAMAHNGAFFRSAGRVHPRWHTPVNAIVMQGICAMAMTLTPFPALIIYIGFSLTFFTVMAVASVFVFRRRADWQRLGAVNFLFPLIPGAYILVGVCMIVYGVIWAPVPSLAALATILAGGAVYRMSGRRAV
ncbi:MAG TPA: amino acid permease [Bryobacteraceae bacterium]|nr:amino acid permease [Bryobacteraceae bacterium]